MKAHCVTMKQLQLLMIVVAVGATVSGCISPRSTQLAISDDEVKKITEEITQLSYKWGQVRTTKDYAFLRRLYSSDFSFTDPSGNVVGLAAALDFFENNPDTFTNSSDSAFNVRVYGKNFAVGNGVYSEAGKDKDGEPFSRKFQCTNVWVRKNGTWKVVAGHMSQLE